MNDSLGSPLLLTRYDVVMWFLRVLLWIFILRCLEVPVNAFIYFTSFKQPALDFILSQSLTAGLPLIILLVFPSMLATNVLGVTTRQSISSLPDILPLIGRCIGIHLLLYSLPTSVAVLGSAISYHLSHPGSSVVRSFFGTPTSPSFWLLVFDNALAPALSCVLGFFLAFGPTIRDTFRSRP